MTEARDQLQKLTECCICFQAFTDPRTLPCIHTFCLECLKQTGDATKKEPGEKMPCPVCRKEFNIPVEGMNGIQKNFFMEDLIDVTTMLQLGQKQVMVCDMCKALCEGDEENTKVATMRCLECRDNFCDMCAKTHRLSKLSKTHNIVKIGSETEENIRKTQPIRNCADHNEKPLDFYCSDCKKILCVSCFVENHASHKCKDVNTVHKEFRHTIENNAANISNCVEEIMSKGRMVEQRKTKVLLNVAETEDKIRQRNLELKEMIDSHANSLLEELSLIKQNQIKKFANDMEEIDRISGILKSFETYCTELISKGSASDVCNCVGELHARSDELEKDHKTFIGRPFQITEVSFKDKDLRGLLSYPTNNIVGQIECTSVESLECALSSQPDQEQSDKVATNATDETKKEKTTDEMSGTLSESGQKISSSIQSDSRERPEKASTTSDMRTKEGQDYEDRENCGITFSDALTKYKEMLGKIRDQVIHIKLQTDKKPSPLLKKEEADKLDRQYHHLIRIRPKITQGETALWRRIHLLHTKVVRLARAEAEDCRFEKMLEHVNNIIADMLYTMNCMRWQSDIMKIVDRVIQNP